MIEESAAVVAAATAKYAQKPDALFHAADVAWSDGHNPLDLIEETFKAGMAAAIAAPSLPKVQRVPLAYDEVVYFIGDAQAVIARIQAL